MAKKPHHDDDQAKEKPGQPDKKSPATPKRPVPDMTLGGEAPLAEPIPAGEATSDVMMAEPIEEAVPASAAEPMVLSDDDVVEAEPMASDVVLADAAEEAVEAAPASEVVEAEPLAEEAVLADEVQAETPAETPPVEAKPHSDVGSAVLADDVVEVSGSSAVLAEEAVAAPASGSEVDLMKLLGEASATPTAEPVAEAFEEEPVEAVEEEPVVEAIEEEPVEAVEEEPVVEAIEEEPIEAVEEEPIVEAEPEVDLLSAMAEPEEAVISDGPATDKRRAAPVADAGPGTDVQRAEHAGATPMPVSDVQPSVGMFDEQAAPVHEPIVSAPASEVIAAHEPFAAAPASEVIAAHEPFAAAPASEIVTAHEPIAHVPESPPAEAAPASGVLAEEVAEAEAMPESAVVAEEAAEEVVEAMPESAVVAEEAAEEVVEAMPESAVVAEEAVEAEAMPSSAVYAEEAVEDAVPASGIIFDEEVAEAMPESAVVAESSSATRKAEAVLGDEVEAAEAVSSISATEEAEPVEAASGVVFDDDTDKTEHGDIDQTIAFQPSSSAAKKADDDELVTEDELAGTSEASAVELGDMTGKKGSSVTGIDKVAEALESGVDLGATAPPEPSVEFDEMIEEAEAEAAEEPVAKKDKKKGKAPKGTGDDIDLNELFGDEEEVAEAAEAEEAVPTEAGTDEMTAEEGAEVGEEAEASEVYGEAADGEEAEALEGEAAEAFDEEVEAAESAEGDELADFDEDEKPKAKKGKKGKDEDEEAEAEAAEDEDEDVSAKKKGKKGKKDKEKATVAAAPARGGFGCLTIIVAMVLPVILIALLLGGVYFGAPDQLQEFAKSEWNLEKKVPPKAPTSLEKANALYAKQKYADVVNELKASKDDPDEMNLRGQARWFAYVAVQTEKKAPLDKDAPEAKEAVVDLEKAKNQTLIDEIRLHDPMRDKAFTDQIADLKSKKESAETDLAKVTKEKEDADKKIDSLADILAKSKVIDDKSKLDAAVVAKTLDSLNNDKTTLAAVNKLLKDAEVKGAGDDGVKEVIKSRDEADKNLLAVNNVLKDEKTKAMGDKGVLEIVDARNKLAKDRDEVLKIVGEAFKEFTEGKIVPDGADPRKSLVEGAKLARQKAESPLSIPLAQLGMSLGGIGSGTSNAVEKTFDLSRVFSELGFFNTREPFIQTPEKKLDTNIELLSNRKKNDAKELGAMTREADWVLSKESKADDDARNKARFVQGLALRNQEKFADARTAFEDTLKKLQPLNKAAPWSKAVVQAHREITDPTVYYIPRMDALRADQDFKAAFDEANTALKAMPDDARLYAIRGMIRFEAVRGKGKVPADAQKDIRADADTAAKDEKIAAESAYIVGLLEEELGNWPEAEKQFRQAIKLHAGETEDVGKYRVSLARLLLRDRGAPVAVPPMPEEKKDDAKDEKKLDKKDDGKDEKKLDKKDDGKDEKKLDKKDDGKDEKKLDKKDDGKDEKKLDKKDDADKKGDAKDEKMSRAAGIERTIVFHPWSTLVVAAVIAQPAEDPDDKEAVARINETMKLAQELINSKNDKLKGQGYILLGSALSKLGKRTEGLKEYSKGLKLVYPGIETKEMEQLIAEHPAFQQPDISGTPNPVMAERHFGEGMHLYWSREFEKAESQFKTAVKYYDKDARYQYYLGLSQLAQKTRAKRDAAYYSFEVGARLEAKSVSTNPYAARDINTSLERIQGPVRELLNSFRFKALDPEADAKAPTPPE